MSSGIGGGGAAPRLSFVGAGRAGSALAVAASSAGLPVVAIASRRAAAADDLAARTGARAVSTPGAAAALADITFLTVPDRVVTSVAATIAASGVALGGRAVVHTAASLGPEAIAAVRQTAAATGVLHPLQALAGVESAPLLTGAYFRAEARGRLRLVLQEIVATLGGQLIAVPPEARSLYHAAAVLAGNAPLALLARAERLLAAAGIAPQTAHAALAALLHGAATNAMRAGAATALTGPVVRGDAATVAAHLAALSRDPDALELYLSTARETARLAGRDLDELGIATPADPEPAPALRQVA